MNALLAVTPQFVRRPGAGVLLSRQQITGGAHTLRHGRPMLAALSSASPWFALRASVLRRAVSLWGRPVRRSGAARPTAGRQDKCPTTAGESSTSMNLPTVAAHCHSPQRLASATKPWPNTALNRNANGGRLLRAPAASAAPFGVRLALR